MACIVIVVTLDESRALKMAVFSEIFLEGGDEEMLLRVEGFACQDTWSCLEYVYYDNETEELNLATPPPAENNLNEAVQSQVFREADTSVGISASSRELSTSHAEEESNKVLRKQKHMAFVDFGSEDRPRKNGSTHEDVIDIRERTDEERDTKRPRREAILKRPLPSEDAVHIRSQAEKESEQKRVRREEVSMEDAQRGTQAKVVEVEQEKVVKRRSRRAGIREKWEQRK
ncbi:hypothetical protein OIDMADRAFT_57133 [Oidiodendron maius Zn]|uniref:Uncharacterized protein n=1 Tax=Oidiodendron maius (strain Zn) TaxID=913774 RepID=A0A0C3H2M4_OIDMZ|nr:hypothetical protein OIDMADRAFT_57133 [Oidiodendron maius Zn]